MTDKIKIFLKKPFSLKFDIIFTFVFIKLSLLKYNISSVQSLSRV